MLNGQTLAWCIWALTGQRLGGTQDWSFWRDALAHQLWVFNHCIMSRHHHVYSLLAPSVEKQFLSSVLWVASPSNHRPPSLMVWFLKHKTSSFLTSSPKCVLNQRQNMLAETPGTVLRPVFSTAQHSAELTFTSSARWLCVTLKICSNIKVTAKYVSINMKHIILFRPD